MRAEHVRLAFVSGQAVARCHHCGVDEPMPALPMRLSALERELEKIVARHRRCPAPGVAR